MKKLLLFLLLLPSLVLGKDIPVPCGSSIANAVASASAGDHVYAAACTFTEPNFAIKPGVNFHGAGVGRTVINNFTFDQSSGGQGAIQLYSFPQADGNQVIEGFTLQGNPNRSFEGIKLIGRNKVTIQNVAVTGFFYSGIEIMSDFEKQVRDITIRNFSIYESSKESGGGSFGNIILRGNIDNLLIRNGTITHMSNVPVYTYGDKSSGYGIKGFSNYGNGDFSKTETITNAVIDSVYFYGKTFAPWGPNVPNFNMEFWNVHVRNFEIKRCFFNMQLSLENGKQKDVDRSFWVHHNTFDCERGQSIELTASHSLVEYNVFRFTKNKDPWNFIGTYNDQKGLKKIIFRYNDVDFGGNSPSLVCAKGQYIDLLVESNVFKNGRPTLVWFRGKNSDGSTVTFRNNTLPAAYNKVSYENISASQVLFTFVDGNATIPDKPVGTPDAVTPPVVTPPVVVAPEPEKPTTTPIPTTPPVTSTPAGVMAIVSPLDQSTIDFGKVASLDLVVVPKAPVLTLKVLRFDTRAEVFSEVIKNAPDTVKRSIPYEKLKATNRYLVEFKTTKLDGTLVRQVYYTVSTKNATVTPPVVTPPPAPTVVPKSVSVNLSTLSNETLGVPVISKDSVNRKYTITIPYNR